MTRKKILAYAAALLIIALVSSAFLRPGDGASPNTVVNPAATVPADGEWAETRSGVVYDGSGSITINDEPVSTIVDGVDIMSKDFYPSEDMTPLTWGQAMLRTYPSVPAASLDVEPPPPEPTDGSSYNTLTNLTAGGATMIVLSKSGIFTGHPYDIEYWNGEEWLPQPHIPTEINWGFTMIGIGIGANSSQRFGMSWEGAYGQLTPGYYRIKKDFGCAQFAVLEDGTATTALPENRFGTAELPEGSVDSLEELVYEADAIAHVRVTSWLGDFEGEDLTAFSVETREVIKGSLSDDFVLIQYGTSQNPCAGFPLFAAGNDLLVFLDEVPQEEHALRVYGKSYRMVGSCRSLYYIGVTDDWDIVAMPHQQNMINTQDLREVAPINCFSNHDAFFAAVTPTDLEFWTSDEVQNFDVEWPDERFIYYLSDLRREINYCIDNPPYLGETVEVYQPLPDVESDFGGVPDILTTSALSEPIESSGDTDILNVIALQRGSIDSSGMTSMVIHFHRDGNWALYAYPHEVDRPEDKPIVPGAAGVIEKLDENGEWQFYDDLVVDTFYDENYPYEMIWSGGASAETPLLTYMNVRLPFSDPGEYRVTYHLHKMKPGGGTESETYTVSHGYSVPERSDSRFELVSASLNTSYIYGPTVSLNLRANEGTLPYLDADSILLEQWLGGNWTKLEYDDGTIRSSEHEQSEVTFGAPSNYSPETMSPHTKMNYELFFNIGTPEELYRLTAEFTENPDGSGERYTLQFKFDTTFVPEDY